MKPILIILYTRETMMHKTKAGYQDYSDEIWRKRYDSPNALRRYVHRRQYYAFLPYVFPQAMVLDAGSGEGVLSYHLSQKCHRVVAMDISKPNVFNSRKILAKKGCNNVLFVVGDAENLH